MNKKTILIILAVVIITIPVLSIMMLPSSNSVALKAFVLSGCIWFTEMILVGLWLAYALNSWRGIGLGFGVGVAFAFFPVYQRLSSLDVWLLHRPFFDDPALAGYALMLGGAIGGFVGKMKSKPGKLNREVRGAVLGWIGVGAIFLCLSVIIISLGGF